MALLQTGPASLARILAVALLCACASTASAQEAGGQPQVTNSEEVALGSRIDAAYAMMQAGNFDEGYQKLRAALLDSARTERYVFTVTSYTKAGTLMFQNNIIDKAEEIFAEGAQTRAMREDVRERAEFYLNYALLKQAQKDFPGTVQTFTAATNLYAQYYGNESRELILANDMLATAVQGFGSLGNAINLEQGNLELAQKVLPPEDQLIWKMQNNLADMLREIGAPSRALKYDLEVLAKRVDHYGPNHFNVLVSANNTAQDYLDLGNYAEALRYFQQNRDIAVALNQDGNLVEGAEAWILYTKVLQGSQPLDDQTLSRLEPLITNADYPDILGMKIAKLLADHFAAAGDDERSMKHLDQVYQIAGHTFGLQHPLTFEARLDLARAKAKSNIAAAAADFTSLDNDMIAWSNMQVSSAGGRAVAEASRAMADDMLYAYAEFATANASIVPAFADAVRRWPTLENGKRDVLRKLLRLIDPNDVETRKLILNGMRLSFTYQTVTSGGNDGEIWQDLLVQLRATDDKLNYRLNEKYGFDNSILDKPLPRPQELLQTNEALVQYFITRKWRADRESADPLEDTKLYAIVTRGGAEPALYDLGDPRKIIPASGEQQVASLRSTRSPQERGAVPITSLNSTFSELYDRLIVPAEPSLAGADTLFVVPDGKLFAVPFSLLRDEKGAPLDERFALRMLANPDSMLNVDSRQGFARDGEAVLAGGLDYRNGAENGAEPLPGTRQEVDAIAAILRKDSYSTEVLTGTEASEAALRKDIEKATIAHLATHGAYRNDSEEGADAVDALWQSEVVLSRSGDRRSMMRDDDDGRLYAMEIMNWDLSGLDLLVLSACETARGQETFVGGLRGLPTAISIAGAKRSLLALWPVDDAGTAEFMVRFYDHLSAGMAYPEALRQTRRDARDGKLPHAKDPRVWAAFVMFEN